MDCTITTTKRGRTAGLTLIELLVAVCLSTVVFAAVSSGVFYCARSFVALANYVDLDNASRSALDRMTTEIRQSNRLVSYSSTNLVFEMTENGVTNNLTYKYNPAAGTLTRNYTNATTTLLSEILTNSFRFSTFKPQVDYDYGPLVPITNGSPAVCKGVQLSWTCSRKILGKSATTESVQSAQIVIRKF